MSVLDPQLRRVVILANPLAGTGPSHEAVAQLVGALQLRQLEPVVCTDRAEFAATVERSLPQVRCVVAAGGDGTVAEVLNRVPGVPLGILPLGNENLVARYFSLTGSGVRLAADIAAGHVHEMDLAQANGRMFALLASAGFDAEVVERVHRGRRGHINRWTYVPAIWQALWTYSFPRIDVLIEDTGEHFAGCHVLVFNLPRYATGLAVARHAKSDDGLLDLCVFERPGIFNVARYAAAVLRQAHFHLPDFHHRLVRSVRLSAEQPAPLQIDGDPAGQLPVAIHVVPRAFRLLASYTR